MKKQVKSKSEQPKAPQVNEDGEEVKDELALEQEEEERKKKEIMRKYYRNRYTSFMDAIKNKKSEDDKAAELAREKQEKKAKRLKDKVLE